MSVRFAISQFMHSLRLPGKRVSALLFALCWLVLNAQLALASHQCDMRPPVENTAMAHNITMQMPDSPEHMQSQSLLCEKHCAPERTQSDSGSVPLVALPVAPALAMLTVDASTAVTTADWIAPTVTPPPAEVQFCRYRE
ncbi:hypothetical protein Rahaq_1951 [Rahnella aceris]|jgi:hypothetical protein|uniref:Uncharacterized protein n=1 Tax=Rahnella sp. (strain Y9602) TaxID=2703885 RepID=A0A0H3FF20_RAHSY|nr:hypothetical protein [Rahnella aceris]ADW73567.1 hypothetical protein Rahaq_1951 [Rahnella aceris]